MDGRNNQKENLLLQYIQYGQNPKVLQEFVAETLQPHILKIFSSQSNTYNSLGIFYVFCFSLKYVILRYISNTFKLFFFSLKLLPKFKINMQDGEFCAGCIQSPGMLMVMDNEMSKNVIKITASTVLYWTVLYYHFWLSSRHAPDSISCFYYRISVPWNQ